MTTAASVALTFDDIVAKDGLAVGDVHVSSAGGGDAAPRKPKARDFRAFLSEVKTVPLARDANAITVDKAATAPRRLKPIDNENSHSPFSYDADALGKLRPDQIPRFLGAVTNPKPLETRTVRLNGLHATQNRVDHGKVASVQLARSIDDSGNGGASKPAVVVRFEGKNYIADGHHRLAADYLSGASTADVKYLDLSPVSQAVKRVTIADLLKATEDEERDDHGRWVASLASGGDTANPKLRQMAREMAARRSSSRGVADRSYAMGNRVVPNDISPGGVRLPWAKADWSIPFEVAKADADHRLLFGWASIVEKDGRLVIDKQQDVILPDDLEKAAYDYVLSSREMDDLHTAPSTGRLVESMVFTKEKQEKLGIHGMLKNSAGEVLDTAWWCGWYADCDDMWAAIKSGKRPELSIGGSSNKIELD